MLCMAGIGIAGSVGLAANALQLLCMAGNGICSIWQKSRMPKYSIYGGGKGMVVMEPVKAADNP